MKIQIPAENSNGFTTLHTIYSDNPLPVIQKGDIIDPRNWSGEAFDEYMNKFKYGVSLEVTKLFHHIFDNKGNFSKHILEVFTQPVPKSKP